MKPIRINAVLFDFDGTLTRPGALDFPSLKRTIGCPEETPVLEFIASLTDDDRRKNAQAELERFERTAAENSVPNDDAEDLILFMRSKGLPIGIITRNRRISIERALQNFENVDITDFDLVVTRDMPIKPKPDPEGILFAAREFNLEPARLLMVGDFAFDIQIGFNAGSPTVFLSNGPKAKKTDPPADFVISRLEELKTIVDLGTPLPAGKLPNPILKRFLDRFDIRDPSVIIRPGVGEDTAAVMTEGADILVLKSDPITFVTDSIGHYAVLINANDIATAGATPRWMLTTLLFPCGYTASEIWQVMHELESVCRQRNIALCGGHTEITDAVSRPVITGMLAGTVAKSRLIDKRNMKTGDRVLLTKAVAVEGTSIIAREFEDRLKRLGMTAAEIEKGKEYLSDLSVLEEAAIAAASDGVTAMHDITEGGLATALEEFSIAGGRRIRVETDKIPYLPQTVVICRLLNLDPLGLIGSGSLLISCSPDAADRMTKRIREAGIQVSCIGEVLGPGRGVEAVRQGRPAPWPRFEVDELARLFSGQ